MKNVESLKRQVVSKKLLSIYIVAVAVRLLFVWLYPGASYYGGITNEYVDAASNLLHGHGLTAYVDIASYSSGLVHFAYLPFIGRPLGYVLIFAVLSLIGNGTHLVFFQIVQALITAYSVILVYRLTQLVFRKIGHVDRLATAASILAAIWPNQARFEVALLPDGLTTLVLLALALYLTRYVQTRRTKDLALAGLMLGGSIYFRPDLVLLPFFLLPVFWILFSFKRAIPALVMLCLFLGIAIGLNAWKNYAISGEFVPLNLGSGTTMYEGISQFGDTLGTTYADERVAHNKLNTKQLFYPEGRKHDQALFREAVDTIEHHPWFYTTVILRRIPLLFTVRGLFFSDSVSLSNASEDLSQRFPGKYIAMFKEHPLLLTIRFLSPLLGWLLVLSAAIGIYFSFRTAREDHAMVLLLLFYFISTHLMTNVEPRYFYPAVPLLYPYALFAFRRWRRAG
jgi:hypothetical protein